MTLHTQGLHTLEQVRAFIAGNAPVAFTLTDHASAHAWMAETLGRFGYTHALRADRATVLTITRPVPRPAATESPHAPSH